jgi:anthranilate/para-aminobenzoate synthase component I
VGFLGYDIVRYFEKLPAAPNDDLKTDDATFLITDTLMIFDNVRHTIKVVACAVTEGREDLRAVYDEAIEKIHHLTEILKAPVETSEPPGEAEDDAPPRSNMMPEDFKAMVRRAKDYIVAGDVIQVVLAQRFQRENRNDPIDLYRALRYINPSPYLFFLKFEDLILIGSSPEVMVRSEEGVVELRPIAGTRRRGKNEGPLPGREEGERTNRRTESFPTSSFRTPRKGPNMSCSSIWEETIWEGLPGSAVSRSINTWWWSSIPMSCISSLTSRHNYPVAKMPSMS